MGLTLQEVLVRALEKLEESSFQRFIEKLSVWEVREEYIKIPKDELTGKDPEHVAGLINEHYKYAYGAEVTLAVLEDIKEKKVRKELQCDLREEDTSGHGLGTTMYTDRINFIEDHRSDRIMRITYVDPVLCDLRDQNLLTQKQYNNVMEKRTSQEKMRGLCDIIRHWEDTGKYTAYTVLLKCNEEIIRDLEMEGRLRKRPHSQVLRDKVNYIENHRSDLIRRIMYVDPVLYDLRDQKLLTQEQYNDVMEKRTSQEKMRELCEIIRLWEVNGKYTAYTVLRKYNEEIIRDFERKERMVRTMRYPHLQFLKGDHFVDIYRSHLIDNIKEVNPVLDDLRSNHLLTEEDYTHLQSMTTPEEKMKRLYDIFRFQSDTEKDQFYISLWRYNYTVINNLEKLERLGKPLTHKTSDAGDHFIDRHKQNLIERIKIIRPVISDLYGNDLLTREEMGYIMEVSESEDKMRRLYDIIRYWDDSDKEKVYRALYKYNPGVTDVLKKLGDSSPLEKKTCWETVEMSVDKMSCKLCGEEEQDLVEVVSTIGNMNRLELTSPGLYRCQKTGIKFLVKGPVIIEYKLDSWSDHLKNIPGTYEILGPLFDIKVISEANAVSAVYLPHYLCLNGFSGNMDWIKCAHFKDGNMTLETPAKIEPFYITLENPTFSFLGAILSFVNLKIPIHGIVLIYFTILCEGDPDEEHRIHLYVLPHTTNVEETLDKENKKFGFQRIKKPEQTTQTVYTKVNYLVTGHPGVSACPETLKFRSEPYHYTEIQLMEKTDKIFLNVSNEKSKDPVWKVHLTQRDIKNITQLLSQLTIHEGAGSSLQDSTDHFLDIHRGDLISMITMVEPVLDDLLFQKLLTREQYNTVHSKPTSQEKMRQLYDFISSWGHVHKDKVMKSLRKQNPSLRVWK